MDINTNRTRETLSPLRDLHNTLADIGLGLNPYLHGFVLSAKLVLLDDNST